MEGAKETTETLCYDTWRKRSYEAIMNKRDASQSDNFSQLSNNCALKWMDIVTNSRTFNGHNIHSLQSTIILEVESQISQSLLQFLVIHLTQTC